VIWIERYLQRENICREGISVKSREHTVDIYKEGFFAEGK
jgi:hypothetical protein